MTTTTLPKALMTVNVPGFAKTSGKVREIFDLGDGRLVIVATDRISAFDVVMLNGIPGKGKILNQLSLFWFDMLSGIVPNHVVGRLIGSLPPQFPAGLLNGRFMLCRKATPLPVECIVRGYLAGSGWKSYQQDGKVCGIRLPPDLKQCAKLPEPIFTPSTKAEHGQHDENISFERACEILGKETAERVKDLSLALYIKAHEYALERGVIIADTKFEWGVDGYGRIILIDEVLTPDSSRFWPADKYAPGRDQESFDKQFVRDWLEQIQFNKSGPGVELPVGIVNATRDKYVDAYEILTGRTFN